MGRPVINDGFCSSKENYRNKKKEFEAGEVVLTEYHTGFFNIYPKLVLKMTSSKKKASIASKLAYAVIEGSRAVVKTGKNL